MKPLSFNLKEAKKISGDKNSSTFKLKDGHEIRVAHAPLSSLQRKQLERLPVHLDEGGDGEEPEDFTPGKNYASAALPGEVSSESVPQAEESNPALKYLLPGPAAPAAEETSTLSPPATDLPDQGHPVGEVKETATGTPLPPNNIAGAVAKGENAIKEQAAYEEALAGKNAATEESDLQARANLMDAAKQNYQDFSDEQHKFLADFMASKIDPNHYLEDKSVPQKISTAIGLFLGGWGSAFTHQGNPALDFLNKQIDRDIDAQKSRIGQQKTLFEANQNLYHDNVLAENATRMQMNDIYAHQLQMNAAKLGTPAAKAKADAAIAQWQIQNAKLLQDSAVRATVLHSVGSGGQGLDAQSLAAAGLMTPAEAEKEQASLNAQKTAYAAVNDIYDRLDKEQTPANLLNPQSYKRVDTLKAELINSIMNASASKRLTRESVEAEVNPLFTKTTSSAETRQAERNAALNMIGKHADPTPNLSKYAPKSLPTYPFQMSGSAAPAQYKVGDIRYVGKGANAQKVQIIDKQGNYRAVN